MPAEAATAKPAAKKPAAKPTSHKLTMKDFAPADEYFGPMKLSILGIRNTIRDIGLRYDGDPNKADSTISSIKFTEVALQDWQKKYPRDPQLPRNIYFLEHLYAKIPTPAGTQKAYATEVWLFTSYGDTPQARQMRKEIAAAKNASPVPVAATPGNNETAAPVNQQQNPIPTLSTNAPASPAPLAPGQH